MTKPETNIDADRRRRLLLVTGLAGAGRSTALKCLEDLGFDAVDNLPMALLPHLASGLAEPAPGTELKPTALGIDSRTAGFSAHSLLAAVSSLKSDRRFSASLLFLDCEDEVLRRRFTETRRRHPLAQDRPVGDGIRMERRLMSLVKQAADLVIDTSEQAIGELKVQLAGHFSATKRGKLAITVLSFSYRRGLPREADLVFDARFLANPHYDPDLRPLSGMDAAVAGRIAADPSFPGFFAGLTGLLWPLLPGFEAEGKSYLTIAVGCTGGRHRSVFMAERLADWLAESGRQVTLRHRDLEAGES
jgi:RNase adapter protein RapZ